MSAIHELILLAIVITILSGTGLWPTIIRGIRELRGERFDEPPAAPHTDTDLSFRLLGLSSSSSWDEVEKAYRKKAKIHHPDHGGDEDTMRALNEAYTLIKKTRGR